MRIARAAALLSLLLVGCAGAPSGESATVGLDAPTYAAFVHPVLERRCGSLDCHGQEPRGLRVYGEGGLRFEPDSTRSPALGPTTEAEIRATYASVVGLEPERLRALLERSPRTTADVYELTLMNKATARERHRGGPSLVRGEPAEQCIARWLSGSPAPDLCTQALAPRP